MIRVDANSYSTVLIAVLRICTCSTPCNTSHNGSNRSSVCRRCSASMV